MDFQREKVYRWERKAIAPHLSTVIPFEKTQGFVDAVWMAKGLRCPPRVQPLPLQNKKSVGDASRLVIRFRETTTLHVLLHEIAHSMTATIEVSDKHGPDFVGVFIDLVDQFGNLPKFSLWFSAEQAGLEVNRFAQPYPDRLGTVA